MHERLPHGMTLLHCLHDEQEQLLRPLLGLGCSTRDTDHAGNAAIHTAALGGHAAVVRMLIMCGADARAKNARQQDALMCAVRAKRNVMVRSRLRHSTDLVATITRAHCSTERTARICRDAQVPRSHDRRTPFAGQRARVNPFAPPGYLLPHNCTDAELRAGDGAHADEARPAR